LSFAARECYNALMDELAENLAAVRAAIAAAAAAAGRDPAAIQLLAVSKTHPAARIRALYALGVRDFGENYAQELVAKAQELADLQDLRLVFIGALQSNKIKPLVAAAAGIQTLADERHARLIAREAKALGKTPYPVHLAVNAGDEPQKHGLAAAAVPALARLIAAELPELDLRGLMAIPPPLTAAESAAGAVPPLYRRLAALAAGTGAGELSLGMSADLAPAVAAGSTCVRIGTALFGARPPRPAPPA
jgi:pyridoxal phosphate enzyme (YggS family)